MLVRKTGEPQPFEADSQRAAHDPLPNLPSHVTRHCAPRATFVTGVSENALNGLERLPN